MKPFSVDSDLAHIHRHFHRRERMAGSTVLITGCAGFLGYYFMHYFARYAGELGVRKVIGLDNFITGGRKWVGNLAERMPGMELHAFDIVNDDLSGIPGAGDAGYILHMASVASPHFYRRYPLETLNANVTGLQKLLDFFRPRPIKGLLMFSSSEVYGDPPPEHIPTAESYRGNVSCVGPRACYDEAKRFCETLCYLHAQQHGMPLALVRPFNNYGPGMSPEDRRLPADFAKAVLGNEDIVMHSDGSPTRTFCYVADALAGYLQALTYGEFEIFNIGRDGAETSVRQMADIYVEQARALLGYAKAARFEASADSDYLTDNPRRRSPDISKARQLLSYNPTVSVEQGVYNYLSFLKESRHA